MTTRGATVTLALTLRDAFGNLADSDARITINNPELSSSATYTTTRTSKGKYTLRMTIMEPGGYDITLTEATADGSTGATLPGVTLNGSTAFGISPGRAMRAQFFALPSTVVTAP